MTKVLTLIRQIVITTLKQENGGRNDEKKTNGKKVHTY